MKITAPDEEILARIAGTKEARRHFIAIIRESTAEEAEAYVEEALRHSGVRFERRQKLYRTAWTNPQWRFPDEPETPHGPPGVFMERLILRIDKGGSLWTTVYEDNAFAVAIFHTIHRQALTQWRRRLIGPFLASASRGDAG